MIPIQRQFWRYKFAESLCAKNTYVGVASYTPKEWAARVVLNVDALIEELERPSATQKTHDDLMKQSVNTLNLTVRGANALENMEIRTIGELVTKSDYDLLRCKNFGRKALNQIKDALFVKGLELYRP